MVKKKKEGKGGSRSKFPSYSEWCHGEEPLACRGRQEVHPAVLWGEKLQDREGGSGQGLRARGAETPELLPNSAWARPGTAPAKNKHEV